MERSWWRDYLRDTRSLQFAVLATLPLAVVYGGGLVWVGEGARSGLDVVSGTLLLRLGVQRYLLALAAVAAAALLWLAWRLRSGAWRYALLLLPVAAEAGLYGAFMGAGILEVMASQHLLGPSWPAATAGLAEHLVMATGAALHEELLFRALLLPLLALAAERGLAMPRPIALGVALVLSSLAFAGAHHLTGEAWDPFAFAFRSFAGAAFGLVWLTRGFGAAAWTHAAYDLFVLTGAV